MSMSVCVTKKWHTTIIETVTDKEEISLPEKCIALIWPVQNAVRKSPNCRSSRIRLDWTNCFAETATKKGSNPSEATTDNQARLD